MVVEAVKTRFDIALHKPTRTCKGIMNLQQRRVTAPFWPESVGVFREISLEYAFKNHSDNFLYQLVIPAGDAQGPLFLAVFLCNILAPGGGWLIAVGLQGRNNFPHALLAHVVHRASVRPGGHTAFVGVNILVRQPVELRVIQVSVKPLKLVGLVRRFFGQTFQYRNWISHDASRTILS